MSVYENPECAGKIKDLPSEELCKIEKCMKNIYLKETSKLNSVSAEDVLTLKNLGITNTQIHDKLVYLLKKFSTIYGIMKNEKEEGEGEDSIEHNKIITEQKKNKILWSHLVGKKARRFVISDQDILVDNKFLMQYEGWRSAKECPFQKPPEVDADGNYKRIYHGHKYGSIEFMIYNVVNDKCIVFNTLEIHMLIMHDFFALDPKRFVETLELEPGINYKYNSNGN